MRKLFSLLCVSLSFTYFTQAQTMMTPELLWQLGRVGAEGVSADGQSVYFGIAYPNVDSNKSIRNIWKVSINGGSPEIVTKGWGSKGSMRPFANGRYLFNYRGAWYTMKADGTDWQHITGLPEDADNLQLSPDGNWLSFTKEVKLERISGSDFYPQWNKSNVQIYSTLNDRHWDEWEDGSYSHVFIASYKEGVIGQPRDIMEGQLFDCPQKPHGGIEDMVWNPNSKSLVYVTKRKHGLDYAVSTNTELMLYDVASGSVTALPGSEGYDMQPAFAPDGNSIAWCSMAREGFEADKEDIRIYDFISKREYNVTANWDGTVGSFKYSKDGLKFYFTAYTDGTEQLFSAVVPMGERPAAPNVTQITKGIFDINEIVGESGDKLVVSRTDMNHAAELYTVELKTGSMTQLTHVNDAIYATLAMPKVEKRYYTTTDGKKMLVWVVLPPNFDAKKKYPTLLYCQGGPQSALSQFYSFRWNFQLMASEGYIVVAPNRRGMPGHGVKWNEAISGDWGGQPIRDYLTAIDSVSKDPYVDVKRRAAVGASYGGYSVYMLAGVHNGRFSSFIAHDGVFDTRSWYGTTEEIWFSSWDMNGPYWKGNNKSFTAFNPSTMVEKWTAPILIYQGGKDFRTPIEQSLQAFQAAQLRGIKSKLVYMPTENHWVLSAQNAMVWQHEFYKWLQETLK